MKGTLQQTRCASASSKAAQVVFSETDFLAISGVLALEVSPK